MGRPRIPDAVKRLRGTLRPSRTNDRAPRPRAARVPQPPRTLSEQERAIWNRLARELAPGVYTASDGTAFRLLVRSVAAAEDPGPDATPSARIHYMRLAAAMLQRFGLDPASREKVTAAPPTPSEGDVPDPMEEFG